MASALSPQDVARLLSERSPDLRVELADKVAASLSGPGLAPGEIALAQDIVRILARDVEAKVRAAVSQSLRRSQHLPRDVALKLADDIDLVALPLLAESLVLTDEDLVDKLAETRKELFNLRFQSATGALENTTRLKLAKREIARILTVQHARNALQRVES